MLGEQSAQRGLFEADHLSCLRHVSDLDYVGRYTFYGFPASQRGKLFRDQDFAELYCPDNGRRSVPRAALGVSGTFWPRPCFRRPERFSAVRRMRLIARFGTS